ncbi:DNA alkylation repair protein [Amycolatopsis jiangsuensis]|uniref:3-methyladenine DNA glycosylase AlkD n=1 Tax=Amycolatopsis jiangsuensis TaxID=1181879 RepID=A0A840IN66_9PSEU|nr:DNA alkylation repair protein [Amycolatopsis jiangsuensis]MBB4682999.1 3-methyladenine DNA glycosylase AlkD [Amycolatopsis jiangsuensis]
MTADSKLVAAVRSGLAELADADRAPAMQAYMKSEMPFRGVPKPLRAILTRAVFAKHPLPDRVSFIATVLELWREAGYREERYAAIALCGERAYRQWQDPGLLPMYDELIVSGAWWDYVDELAIRRVGPILRAYRAEATPVVRRWALDTDRWRRRAAVICQVGAKHEIDHELLTTVLEANAEDPDFFLRKGIGWALRDHARVAPEWVRTFVRTHPALSALSTREALKHLG